MEDKNVALEYKNLITDLLDGKINTTDFIQDYLRRFKKEKQIISPPIYELLEVVFGAADSFTDDPKLLKENPEFYLNNFQFREILSSASLELENKIQH